MINNQQKLKKPKMKFKFTPKKKLAVIAFALYLTFILLSIVPYIAENEIRGVREQMNGKYVYYLEFTEDGESSHYYVIREDNTQSATIQLTYTTETHTLDVEVKNIRNLVIDCKSIYNDESMKVFKESPFENEYLYDEYFTEERDEFKIIVKTDTTIDDLRFKDSPEPVSVIVNNEEEWWKGGEGVHWDYEGNDIVIYNIEAGTHDITLYFKLILPPKAIFKIEEINTELVGKTLYGFINREITFNGSDSHDKLDSGTIENYEWNFGDDNYGTGKITTHTYTKTGPFNITLEVTDNRGLKANITKEIFIIISSNDRDMDGMDDAWEKNWGLDTTKDDSQDDNDDDQLKNIDEFKYNTNPLSRDSDGDKFSDYEEIMVYQTNASDINDIPIIKKTDGDGDDGDNTGVILGVVAVIVVVIILIILFLIIKKRKSKEEEKEPTEEPTEVKEFDDTDEEDTDIEDEGEGFEEPEVEEIETIVSKGKKSKVKKKLDKPPEKLTEKPGSEIPVRGPPKKKKGKKAPKPEEDETDKIELSEDEMMPPPNTNSDLEEPFSLTSPEEGISIDDLASEMESMKIPMDDVGGDVPPPPPDSDMSLDIDTSGLGLDTSSIFDEGMPGEATTPIPPTAPPDEPELSLSEDSEHIAPEPGVPEPDISPYIGPEEESEMSVKDYVKKGALLFKEGKYSEAIIEWQKALDIEPDHPEIVESIKEAMMKMKQSQ